IYQRQRLQNDNENLLTDPEFEDNTKWVLSTTGPGPNNAEIEEDVYITLTILNDDAANTSKVESSDDFVYEANTEYCLILDIFSFVDESGDGAELEIQFAGQTLTYALPDVYQRHYGRIKLYVDSGVGA